MDIENYKLAIHSCPKPLSFISVSQSEPIAVEIRENIIQTGYLVKFLMRVCSLDGTTNTFDPKKYPLDLDYMRDKVFEMAGENQIEIEYCGSSIVTKTEEDAILIFLAFA